MIGQQYIKSEVKIVSSVDMVRKYVIYIYKFILNWSQAMN